MEIVGSFFGAIAGCLIYRYLEATLRKSPEKPPVEASVVPLKASKKKKTVHTTSKLYHPILGSILHAPTPEEERVQKQKEFEKKVYEGVSKDFR